MTDRRLVTTVIVVAVAITSVALAQGTQKSLFDRLGGRAGITAVVDDFVANCAADTRINRFFAETAKDPKRMAMFKSHLVDQLCEVWDSRDSHRASLQLPAVRATIARARPMIAGFESSTETEPVGGVGLPRS